jgi:anti-sigma factor RsiW
MECPLKASGKKDLLLDYCARRLDSPAEAALEAHIATCPACKSWTEEQMRAWAALDDWLPAPISASFDSALYERIASERTRMPWWRTALRPLAVWRLKPALSLALASLLVVALWIGRPKPVPPPNPNRAQESLDADRLEKALDDVEMLRQLDSAATPDAQSM